MRTILPLILSAGLGFLPALPVFGDETGARRFDPAAIIRLLDDAPAASREYPAEPAYEGPRATVPLTEEEATQFREQLSKCWRPHSQSTAVALNAVFSPEGAVIWVSPPEKERDGRYQSSYVMAKEALRKCAPYALPKEKYPTWRKTRLNFNPPEGTTTKSHAPPMPGLMDGWTMMQLPPDDTAR
ncbi:hypothetical protein [Parvibaculum sp.]|uniref:hypothetical protein n=1 Tax=Parvibaculum sp. TaxID=2024848 RepID=UPI001D4366FA|nr:hypothetical protein [Parvibaculum sp.]MBX3489793.1 hypothetical protein [Parvibaculum sp.]MCW5726249.1 hypothetical protein [Parvibaculum sp.]